MLDQSLIVKIKLESLITEREGMVAENNIRISLGHSMAYSEDSFTLLANKMDELLGAVVRAK